MREEIRDALRENPPVAEDRFLTIEEAAKMLNVSSDWLYRNSGKLPFRRKLGPKMVRFSSRGIQKYLAAKSWNYVGAELGRPQ